MNKKVLSAILFSALFAGTGTFTSCIDTDEPAGIEELRGAKAELLRAKVSVEQAQASLVLAQAEVEKAKAAKKLAEAKISEAQARLDNALAEAQEAATAQAKAEAEQRIAEIKQEMAEAAAQHEIDMLGLNGALAEAQRTYDLMLAKIEIAKAVGSSEVFVTISELQHKVKRAQFKVNEALAAVEEAEAKYQFAVAYDETHGELNAKRLEAYVAAAEEGLATAQAELAMWEGYLANAENADWAKEIKALDDSIAAIKKDTVELRLAINKALMSDSLLALGAAAEEAAKPATADSVYGHKYFGAEYATTLHVENNKTVLSACATATEEAAKKAEINVKSLELIAKYNATTGVLEGGQLFVDKDSLAGFTTEVKAFLDTIAATAVADTTLKAKSDAAIKTWKDALAAYNAVDTTMQTKLDSANSKKTAWTATADKSPKKIDAYRKAMLDYLTVAVKNGAVLNTNKVLVPQDSVWVATGNTATKELSYALEDALTVLADTTKTYYAISQGVDFINAGTGTKELTVVDKATAKSKKFKFDLNVIKTNAKNTNTLYSELVDASNAAFGLAKNYVKLGDYTTELEAMQNGYLHTQPSETDVKNLYTYQGVTDIANNALGAYGKYLYAEDTDIQAFAKNYPAIMANLETAIAYWEATYKTLQTKYTAWETAKKAADDAFNNYTENVIAPMETEIAALKAKEVRFVFVQDALCTALAAYLPEEFKAWGGAAGYDEENEPEENLKAFVEFLEVEIEEAKTAVEEAEDALADAQMWATLIENGEGIVELAQAELDEAIANLEAKQAKLETALANLAKGLEIIAAVNAAE